jgi:hypothetical protein
VVGPESEEVRERFSAAAGIEPSGGQAVPDGVDRERKSWPEISRRPHSHRYEKSALVSQHSDDKRQREVAAGLDDLARATCDAP